MSSFVVICSMMTYMTSGAVNDFYFHCSCGHKAEFSEEYDASFCPLCADWFERGCIDKSCEFCKERNQSVLTSDTISIVT